ncbi:hypothetical protein PoB_004402000 [Plakobranchus ocellatus]|uniref:Uncharacterized protein n=1 Tax=Plakobranchus ocellatus TaxID=259542 RepID=A0AAV4BA85_9GAST|nr:hypothetical protein PoB_004402000 [Plakobranchus ocellatus]
MWPQSSQHGGKIWVWQGGRRWGLNCRSILGKCRWEDVGAAGSVEGVAAVVTARGEDVGVPERAKDVAAEGIAPSVT